MAIAATVAAPDEHGQQQPLSLIIDCDPAGLILTGLDVDDDLALLNAFSLQQSVAVSSSHDTTTTTTTTRNNSNSGVRLLGITVTGGNAPLRYSAANARALIRHTIGDNRVGIYTETQAAATFILETLRREPEHSVTIVCLGPLTNVAAAVRMQMRDNDTNNSSLRHRHRLKQIVIMGGTLTPGMPLDLNMRSDPDAAALVLAGSNTNYNYNSHSMLTNVPKIVVPIETCVQAVFGPAQLERVRQHCQDNNNNSVICRYQSRLWWQVHLMPYLVNWRFVDNKNARKQHAIDENGKGGGSKRAVAVSEWIDQGFIVWDLVALWTVIQPDLFDDWTYYRVHYYHHHQPQHDANVGWRQWWWTERPQQQQQAQWKWEPIRKVPSNGDADADYHNVAGDGSNDNNNIVKVPRTIRNETHFLDRVMDHLLTDMRLVRHDHHQQQQHHHCIDNLSLGERVGMLPTILMTLLILGLTAWYTLFRRR